MPQLAATLLGCIIIAVIAVGITHRFEDALHREIYQNAVLQAARQQATFARAVLAYLQTYSPAAGTYITISVLQNAGDLSLGFPSENPFQQVSEAIVGSGGSAIVTYEASPGTTALQELGLQYGVTLTTEALALNEASAITAMQEGLPSLVGGMISGGNFYTPFQTIVIPVVNYVPLDYLPNGIVFADLVNIAPAPTLSSPSTASYPAVTGD